MAAVRPAGPEPTMMTLRGWEEVMAVRSRSLIRRMTLAKEQHPGNAQDSTDDEVAQVDGATVRQGERQQHLQGPRGADQHEGEGDDAEDPREQAVHDAAGDVDRGRRGSLADLADDPFDGVGEVTGPAGVSERVPGHGRRAYSCVPH